MMSIRLSTESDRAMDDFRKSEECYRFIFSSVSDPLMLLDDKWTVIDINHPAEALLGYDRIDLYGTNIKDLVAGDRQTDLEQQLLKMEGSRNGELVLRFKRKDGRVFEGKFSYSVFHTGDNSYIQGLISGEEVKKESTTARMNAQSEYSDVGNKELADILKGIAESSADIIYIKNSQGKYLFVNDAFAGWVGKPRNEIIGRNGHDFLKMDRAERYRRYTEKALATSRPVVYLDFFSGGPQERVFHTTESPIELGGDGIRLVAGIGRDITDLHRQEERIRIINAELDEFVHKVSHDLRAPLRNISGYIEMAFEKEGEQRRNLLDKAIDQCNKLQSFISRLLELSKAGRTVGNFQDFDSASLVNEVYDLFRSQYQDVELRIDGKLPVIFGDRSSLVQVLQNIMQNALDHLDRTKPKAFVSISAEKKDDEVVFFIRDNGSGIKKSVLDKIFAPSAMIESKGVKTHGFGLSICHRIIEAHKGRIWAESVEGEGSTFYFSLPLSSGQSD